MLFAGRIRTTSIRRRRTSSASIGSFWSASRLGLWMRFKAWNWSCLVQACGMMTCSFRWSLNMEPPENHSVISFSFADIKEITCRTHEACIRIIDKQFKPMDNFADRDHCIQYMAAIMLVYGAFSLFPNFREEEKFYTPIKSTGKPCLYLGYSTDCCFDMIVWLYDLDDG